MESKSIFDSSNYTNSSLELTWSSISFLREAAKWAKFLSILGFIGIGFIVIFSFFAGAIFSMNPLYSEANIPGFLFTIIYLIVAVIAFFPTYFMYKFADDVKNAINLNNTEKLTSGLGSLKSYFKFNGILAIIVLSSYVFFFIVMIITLVAAGVSAF